MGVIFSSRANVVNLTLTALPHPDNTIYNKRKKKMKPYYIDPLYGRADADGLTPKTAINDYIGLPLEAGDAVLFKASRAVRMERVIEAMKLIVGNADDSEDK